MAIDGLTLESPRPSQSETLPEFDRENYLKKIKQKLHQREQLVGIMSHGLTEDIKPEAFPNLSQELLQEAYYRADTVKINSFNSMAESAKSPGFKAAFEERRDRLAEQRDQRAEKFWGTKEEAIETNEADGQQTDDENLGNYM
jgi:hypothetical protein